MVIKMLIEREDYIFNVRVEAEQTVDGGFIINPLATDQFDENHELNSIELDRVDEMLSEKMQEAMRATYRLTVKED